MNILDNSYRLLFSHILWCQAENLGSNKPRTGSEALGLTEDVLHQKECKEKRKLLKLSRIFIQ